ncbi:hypothetical protein BHE90_012731 [Fusarium euwallaceae]|uniref:DUF7137 domain-containing protein n=5 Tax=Fusarium solani species complex TaxID=232080 RepID=A0A3M2RTL7_9HYPO|nr:hypothetical protein CDV36_011789 [Fusarium kuroshium]RSL48457.1 hypothetical protein CEP53_009530 [Fusarium sp. AF-6]RSL77658.1 hypothetical protein CEP51_008870 [Fusarium floridanum]RSL93628.1 hypothetical protein CDV31_014622 [Fusarium ambrosium]RSM02499.1 hypothetical protein CEP52_007956 [Fusarium oligoseptatum]RTE72847.1 hypothetical protein BHE90_012731 [Fusarium euwallaceae]
MRPASGLVQLAVCVSSLAPLTAAWPEWFLQSDSVVVARDVVRQELAQETGFLEPRADEESTTQEEATKTGKEVKTVNLNTAKIETETGESKADDKTNTDEETETATGKETGKKGETGKTNTKDAKPTRTSYSFDVAAGGVNMQTPETLYQPTPLYKIGDYATFGWNYTSLKGTPTAIDVLVSCSANAETYTLAANTTFEKNPSYTWDTGKQANDVNAPLVVGLYTLIIKDSDMGISDVPDPGYLSVARTFQFGMYTPRDYVPYSEWTCDVCNSAPGLSHGGIAVVLSMTLVTIASFTWFVTGLGLQ